MSCCKKTGAVLLPEASGQCPVRKSGDKAANPLYDNIIRQL